MTLAAHLNPRHLIIQYLPSTCYADPVRPAWQMVCHLCCNLESITMIGWSQLQARPLGPPQRWDSLRLVWDLSALDCLNRAEDPDDAGICMRVWHWLPSFKNETSALPARGIEVLVPDGQERSRFQATLDSTLSDLVPDMASVTFTIKTKDLS